MKKIFYKILPLLLIFSFFISCEDEVSDPTQQKYENSISGIIVDEQDIPVPDAEIKAYDNEHFLDSDTSSEDGSFELSGIPDELSRVSVVITHPEFVEFQGKLSDFTEDGDNKNARMKMMHNDSCCGKIKVWVKSSSDSSALNDVEIRLNKGKKTIRKSYTNSGGYLEFLNVCPGEYWIRAAKNGYRVIEKQFIIEKCDSVEYRLYAESTEKDTCCSGKIYIIPKDKESGDVLNGAKVKLWKDGKEIAEKKVEGGYAFFEKLCEGKYGVDIIAEGYKNIEFLFELGCDQAKEIVKELEKEKNDSCCEGVIYVIAHDSTTNDRLKNVYVKLRQNGTLLTKQITNADGIAVFKEICEGKYEISMIRDGYKSREFSIEMGCNDTLELHKKMLEEAKDTCCTARFKVKVKDKESGIYLENAAVKLFLDGKVVREGKTNGDGWVLFENLCAPFEYKVYIEKDGYYPEDPVFFIKKCIDYQETFQIKKK